MDMFIAIYNVEQDEIVYINKNHVDIISVNIKDNFVGLTICGNDTTYMKLTFNNMNDVNEFMKAIEGKVYKIPEVRINVKSN